MDIDIERINRVWERVTERKEINIAEITSMPSFKSEREPELCRFIEEEQRAAREFNFAASRTRRQNTRVTLCRMASGACARARELQREYFLLTGDTFASKTERASGMQLLGVLRARYLSAEDMKERYKNAAEVSSGGKRDMYLRFSKEREREMDALRGILDSVIF